MEPVTHTTTDRTDRKQNNDLGLGSLVQQSLEYRRWRRGCSPPAAAPDSRQGGAVLPQPGSTCGCSTDSCGGIQLRQWQPGGTRTLC